MNDLNTLISSLSSDEVGAFLAFAKAFTSCTPTHKVEEEIANIQVDVDLVTFHKEFANANAADLPRLKKEFPLFFPPRVPDSLWIFKINRKRYHS